MKKMGLIAVITASASAYFAHAFKLDAKINLTSSLYKQEVVSKLNDNNFFTKGEKGNAIALQQAGAFDSHERNN